MDVVTQKLAELETKRIAKRTAEKGEKNAVQESSTEEVSVRKRATGGEGVRQKDTGKRKAAKEVIKVEAKPEEKWDAIAEQYGLPKFVDLPSGAQADVLATKGEMTLAKANEIFEANEIKFSLGVDRKPDNPTSVEATKAALKKLFFSNSRFEQKVTVVESIDQLPEEFEGMIDPTAQAFVTPDGSAFMITGNIAKGSELAVFLHEVGVHLGMQGLIGKSNFYKLARQIDTWSKGKGNSQEEKIARKAFTRVSKMVSIQENAGHNPTNDDIAHEFIAYFVEEAVNAGVNPTAISKVDSPIGNWFRTLWASVKSALRKFGFDRIDQMTAQNIVDLAYGAASLELDGSWHGTAADFRNFDHEFMGAGEGAQAFGWGTYLAQRVGIAKGYWENDVRRKDKAPVYNGKPISAFDSATVIVLENINQATQDGTHVVDVIDAMRKELTLLATNQQESASARARYRRFIEILKSLDPSKLDMVPHVVFSRILGKYYGQKLTQPVVHPETLETIAYTGEEITPLLVDEISRQAAESGIDEVEIGGNIIALKRPKSQKPEGALMRTSVAATENEMLDRDKLITEQSPYVQARVYELYPEAKKDRELTGADVYARMVQDEEKKNGTKNADKRVSEKMDAIGIKGLMYLDKTSRDAKTVESVQKTLYGAKTLIAMLEQQATQAKSTAEKKALEQEISTYKAVLEQAKQDLIEAEAFKPTRNLVVFNAKNVQRVVTQQGADKRKMRFSYIAKQSQEWVGGAKTFIDNLPTWARGPLRTIHNVLFNGKETALGLMITEDLAELAKKFMSSVTKYVEVQHLRNSLIAGKERRLTSIKTMFEDLDTNTRRNVNDIIASMTINGKWAFDPQLAGVKPESIDPALQARYNALPTGAQKVIQEVFATGRESLQEKKNTIRKIIDEDFAERMLVAETDAEKADVARRKANMEKQFASILNINPNTPYAPLKRFGSFVVVAKSPAYMDAEAQNDTKEMRKLQSDESHYIVEFAETAGEAEEIYDELNRLGKYKVDAPFKKSTARDSLYRGVDLYKGFAKLKRVLAAEKGVEKSLQTKDAELLDRLETMVNDLYLLSLADSSARKSEMQRKKIAGFNRDMMRAFFTQGMADAHYIANLKTADQSMDTMVQMQKEAGENRAEAYPYLNELMAREAQSLEVREPSLGDAMNRMAGDWFLTFSPSFYFQQLTQTYVLSLPWLAGKYNYFKSERALRKAYKDIFPLIKDTGLKEHMDFSNAPEDVRDMLKTLVGRGRIDIGVEAELGGFRSEAGNLLSEAYTKSTNRLRGAINRIEALNRSVAAIAAYRLEMQKSGDKTKAIDAADKVVHVTHGSYDGFNTPRLFNKNAVTRSLTQFRRFQIIQLSMLARMVRNAFSGASKTERAMGRKQLAFLLGHTFALGGVKGMPIFVPAALTYSLLTAAFGDEDDPEDFEAWLRSKGGLLLARGIPANMGVDLSGKLGMGNVLSLLPYTDVDLSSKQGYANLLLGASGPFLGGLVPKMIDGVNLVAGGDYYRGLEQMLPNGLNNGIKMIRFNTEGVTMRNGDVVMSPEDIGFADTVFQGLGMPTTTITERQYRQGEVIKFDQFYNERSKEVKRDFIRAYKDNDSAAMSEARDAWTNLQESRVKYGYTRKPLSELLKAPRDQVKRERSVVSGIETKKSNKAFVQRLSEE